MTEKQQYIYGSYICKLPNKIQMMVKREVYMALKALGESSENITENVDKAMASRLNDLEDLIDVEKIMKRI